MSILEVPGICCLPTVCLRKKILDPMLLATGGTILAAELAIKHKWAINLSGGYHHASQDAGSGFCAIADISIAIDVIRKKFGEQIQKVMIGKVQSLCA
jgi:histone deacetylase 11